MNILSLRQKVRFPTSFSISRKKWTISFALLFGFFILILFLGVGYVYVSDHVLSREAILSKYSTGLTLLDQHGNEFFKFDQIKKRYYTPLSQIPPFLQQAVVASEDRDFYQHNGLSLKAIGRSLIKNLEEKEYAQGGSTITQQLVKNILLNSEKKLLRKYQEIILAQYIESKYSKDEILEMYLNSVYFGEGAIGIQRASRTYFEKDVQELTVAEGALLVGILPAPSALSPISGNLEGAITRQHIVLEKLVEQGHITAEQRDAALQEPLVFQKEHIVEAQQRNQQIAEAAKFAVMIKDQLEKEYGKDAVAQSKFVVKTSFVLNKAQQNLSQESIASTIDIPKAISVAKQLGITTIKRNSNDGISFILGTDKSQLLDVSRVDKLLTSEGVVIDPKLREQLLAQKPLYLPSLIVEVGLSRKDVSFCGPSNGFKLADAQNPFIEKALLKQQENLCQLFDSKELFTAQQTLSKPVADAVIH